MSLVTLNEFLKGSWRDGAEVKALNSSEAILDATTRTLAAIKRSVLFSESNGDLSEEIDSIRLELCSAYSLHSTVAPGMAARCSDRVEQVLETFQKRTIHLDKKRADDFWNVLEMLNEGLSYLAADVEKNETRRRQLENNLTQATRLDDITVLRKQLTKILHMVREEAKEDRVKAEQVLSGMGRQIQQVHRAQSRFNTNLPGRMEAVEYIRPILQTSAGVSNFFVALFVADSLPALRERHGEEVGNTILQELGRKQVQRLMPDGRVFCWSANALLLAWNHKDAATAGKDIASRLRSPCEQRAFTGSRVAVFNIPIRSLVVQPRGSMDDLLSSLDRFYKRS